MVTVEARVATYIPVEPFHLDVYIAEQVFRYNNRKDAGDFAISGFGDALLGLAIFAHAEIYAPQTRGFGAHHLF